MQTFESVQSPVVYLEKFKVGDVVVSTHYVDFYDGTHHAKGQKIVVTSDTLAYYNVCHKNYDLFERN